MALRSLYAAPLVGCLWIMTACGGSNHGDSPANTGGAGGLSVGGASTSISSGGGTSTGGAATGGAATGATGAETSSGTTSGQASDGGSSSDGGAQVSAMIGAAGGTLTSADGQATVTIPPGALEADTLVTIAPAAASGAPLVGPAYEIGPTGQQFQTPIRVAIKVDTNALGGASMASLELATLAADGWHAMGVARIDDAAGTVSGETTHFSIYGLIRTLCQNDDDCALPERCLADAAGAAVGAPKTCGIPCRSGVNGPIDCPAPLVCREGRCLEQSCSFLDPECPDGTNCYIPTVAGVPADAIPGFCRGEACAPNVTDPAGDFFVANGGCGLPPNQLLACPWIAEGLSSCDFIACDATHACPEGHSCVRGDCLLTSAGCSCDAPGCPCTPAGGSSDGGATTGGTGATTGATTGITTGGATTGTTGATGGGTGDAGASCPFAGTWSGDYSGVASGAWTVVVDSACHVTGSHSGVSPDGKISGAIEGTVAYDGTFALQATFGSAACPWQGSAAGSSATGTWTCAADVSGTWSGQRTAVADAGGGAPMDAGGGAGCKIDTQCPSLSACRGGTCVPCTQECVDPVCDDGQPCTAYGNGCTTCGVP